MLPRIALVVLAILSLQGCAAGPATPRADYRREYRCPQPADSTCYASQADDAVTVLTPEPPYAPRQYRDPQYRSSEDLAVQIVAAVIRGMLQGIVQVVVYRH